MAEEGNEIIQPATEQVNPVQERITQLSDKVKTASDERDTAKAAAAEAERRAAFAEGFVDIVTTQPAAKDFKDDIKAKVLSGYTVQDATYAVLGAAGKLGGTPVEQPRAVVAGGSADTTITDTAKKSPAEMTLAEKRAQLEKDLIWQ